MNERISDHDEFLLGLLLDGELPETQEAELRGRLEREPLLRAAWTSLGRVDQTLRQRRSDRLELNWGQFRREVMFAVGQEALPGTLRLSRWVRIGAVLAAAAGLALVVSLYRPYPNATVNPAAPPSQPTGQLLVRLERPEPSPPTGEIQIRFARSQELAQAIRAEDQTNERRISAVRITSAAPRLSKEALAALMEGLAL